MTPGHQRLTYLEIEPSQAHPISTFDLDIVYRRTDDNNTRLAAALQRLNALYKDPAGRRIVPNAEKLATINFHLLRTDLGNVDVLVRVGKRPAKLWRQYIPMEKGPGRGPGPS